MIQLIIKELKRRAAPTLILDALFPEQRQVASEQKRKIAVLTPRRSGKSYLCCSLMIAHCQKHDNSRCLYLGLTFSSIKRIAFDIVLEICNKFDIKVIPNKTDLSFEFENGSKIELSGADSHVAAADKFLGAKFDIIVIDEAASFNPSTLDYLIDSVLMPTLIDKRGKIILVGTPRRVESGRFYNVTTAKPKDWAFFTWNTTQNPYIAKQYLEEIEEMKKSNPDIEKEPFFVREYLGEWCKDITDNVYKFNPNINLISELPKGEWRYVLGVDIGWVDDCAFCLCGWRKYDKTFYIISAFKAPNLLIDEIANRIKMYIGEYAPTIVCDTSNRTVAEELQHRYSIPIIAAERTNKDDWIEVMNNEFILKKIKVLDGAEQYIKEAEKLQWEYLPSGKRIEHPEHPNHLTDSSLYAFRFAYPYLERAEVKKTVEDVMFEHEVRQVNKKKGNWRI